jgi:hypothetical protein
VPRSQERGTASVIAGPGYRLPGPTPGSARHPARAGDNHDDVAPSWS